MLYIFMMIFALAITGCGVKGDPKPPLTPAALGHGQPSFKRANKTLITAPGADSEGAPRTKTDESTEQE